VSFYSHLGFLPFNYARETDEAATEFNYVNLKSRSDLMFLQGIAGVSDAVFFEEEYEDFFVYIDGEWDEVIPPYAEKRAREDEVITRLCRKDAENSRVYSMYYPIIPEHSVCKTVETAIETDIIHLKDTY
jgi:hypothetical protein